MKADIAPLGLLGSFLAFFFLFTGAGAALAALAAALADSLVVCVLGLARACPTPKVPRAGKVKNKKHQEIRVTNWQMVCVKRAREESPENNPTTSAPASVGV